MISIIIPTYNSEKTFKRCLDSIINQSYSDFEIVIIDGLSTDNTLSIIKEYAVKYPNIKYLSEKDAGIYDAMNKGICLAQGEWLYFLGSDDSIFEMHVLESIMMEINRNPDMKVIYGNVLMHGSNQYVQDGFIHSGYFDLKKILFENICQQAIFYHYSIFSELGKFNKKYVVYSDYDFNLRCFSKFEFHYIDIIVANFTVGGQSTIVNDESFLRDKTGNIIRYFYPKLFNIEFINSRYYIKEAFYNTNITLNWNQRIYCFFAYAWLKTLSIFSTN